MLSERCRILRSTPPWYGTPLSTVLARCDNQKDILPSHVAISIFNRNDWDTCVHTAEAISHRDICHNVPDGEFLGY
jgi:hypothetical protein